jgi:hypothetical protein
MLRAMTLLALLPLVLLSAQEPAGFAVVLEAQPRIDVAAATVTGAAHAVAFRDGIADFAAPDAHIDFGPDARLARDQRASFTVECELRTTPGGFATALMCRDGDRVAYSLVLGRRPGTVSFEVWSWQRDSATSTARIDDGEWHRLQAAYDASHRALALLVDGRLEAVVPVTADAAPLAQPRLRLGNNIDTHQPYPGALRAVAVRDGVPPEIAAALAERAQWLLLAPALPHERMERWLEHQRRPRQPGAASAAEWQRRAHAIRSRLQDALGLWPPPYARDADLEAARATDPALPVTDFARARPQLALDLREGGSLERDGYRLTRVYWQSLEGWYASGWLYRPTGRDGRRAAVLCPHGHWQRGARHPVVQARCIALARHGYVVLAVDSVHVYDDPIGLSPLSLMTWNNLRALELLRSLPEVDAARIGCTGASGGGQQTFYLTGLEAGLAAAAPAVMVCYFEEILLSSGVHCHCNFTPGLMAIADEPELSAAFAPRPQLFLSVTGDWTKNFPLRGFPEIRSVYSLFDASDRVRSLQWTSEHDYNRDMRNAMYAFFDRWLNGVAAPDPEIEPPGLSTEPASALDALDRADVPNDLEAVKREFRARLGAAPVDGSPASLGALRQRLERRLLDGAPRGPSPALRPIEWRGFAGSAHLVPAGDAGIELPLVVLRPEKPSARAALLVGDGGKAGLLAQRAEWIEALLREGHAVALADVRYCGEWDVARAWRDPYGKIFGRDEGVLAVHDLLRLRAALHDLLGAEAELALVAFGERGAPALLAAALEPRFAALVAAELGPTYRAADRRPKLTGILRAGDLPDAACLLAPRPVLLGGCAPADFARSRGCHAGLELRATPATLAETLRVLQAMR